MVEYVTFMLSMILVLGITCQWLAWWVRVPAILFLLVTGLALGPGLHILNPDQLLGDLLFPLVSLAVAIILFEGSLSLKFHELENIGKVIRNLVSIGYAITVIATMVLAHFLFHLPWQLSLLFGAITSIGGPTVVAPIIRSIRLKPELNKILHWESILIDPVGALTTVLIFGLVSTTLGHAQLSVELGHFIAVIFLGSLLGVGFGLGLGTCLKNMWLPEYLTNVGTLTAVVMVYTLTDWVDSGGGLLAASLMGITMANMKDLHIKDIVNFKESLSVLMISGLFIILAARVQLTSIHTLLFSALLLFIAIQFIIRPVAVWVCCRASALDWREKMMLSWICPRGIVTAAVSALFSFKLLKNGYHEAEPFAVLSFVMIVSTVIFQSLTAKPVAAILKQITPNPTGIMLVGANHFSIELAKICLSLDIPILMVDTNWYQLSIARLAGIETYYGDVLSAETSDHLNTSSYGHLFILTASHEYNVLCCLHYKNNFKKRRVSTLIPSKRRQDTERADTKSNKTYRRLFSPSQSFGELNTKLGQGASIKATKLTEQFTFADYMATGQHTLLLSVSPNGAPSVFTNHDEPNYEPGYTIIGLVNAVALP